MARRFVRVDLSDGARDFRPVAIEPGVAVLDRPGATAKILFKWLGGMVAEPEWRGDRVDFFVRDDHGGRLEEVVCQPASSEDLQGLLKDDMALLSERLEKAKADSSTERAVLARSGSSLPPWCKTPFAWTATAASSATATCRAGGVWSGAPAISGPIRSRRPR